MSKLGTTIRCTAGALKKPCAGIFRTAASGELARQQFVGIGWQEVAIAGGGVGYRCPIHGRLEPEGPVYLYRAEERDDAQLTMGALGIDDAAAPLMHADESQASGAKGRR